ncbi:MAG: lysoplasmalogenase [Anaerolineaceae bacterium]|nr:lysoplasmalogenase [Anaerolineaceae bacterium]
MIYPWSFFVAIAFAMLDWYAAWKENRILLYIAKPATLLFIILWTLQVSGWQGAMIWFGLGLVLSLAGDVALLFPPRYFMLGLGFFLLAHLAFIVGFNVQLPPSSWITFVVAVIVGISGARILRVIRAGIARLPAPKKMMRASMAYGIALALMLLSALLTFFNPVWSSTAASVSAIGAGFFFISDTTLSYDRFVKKIPHGRFWVHVTYHLGILGIVSGAMLHFVK